MARTWGACTEEGVKSAVKSLGRMAGGPVPLFSSCFHRKEGYWNLPGSPGVKNPPSNTGDVGSIPGRRTKIQHAAEQLSPRAPLARRRCTATRSCMPQPRPSAATTGKEGYLSGGKNTPQGVISVPSQSEGGLLMCRLS